MKKIVVCSLVLALAACSSSSDSSKDTDLDGIIDANDNCPLDANADQADTDLDGKGDACEPPVPSVSMIFPSSYSATEATNLTVRGSSANASEISTLTVNGVSAQSTDDFATWTASIPLSAGRNNLSAVIQTVTEEDTLNFALGHIESNAILTNPSELAFNAAGTIAYIKESSRRQILEVDMTTGERSVLSSAEVPNTTNEIGNTYAIELDETGGRLFLGNRIYNGSNQFNILEIDTDTGARSILTGDDIVGVTNLLSNTVAAGMAYEASNKELFVATGSSNYKILKINADSENGVYGFQEEISSGTVPDALNPFARIYDMVMDTTNKRLITLDSDMQLIEINIDESNGVYGARTLIQTLSSMVQPNSIALKDANTLLVYDQVYSSNETSNGTSDVYEVNLSTNAVTLISDGDSTTEYSISNQGGIFYDAANGDLYVRQSYPPVVHRMDLSDGSYQQAFANLYSDLTGIVSPIMSSGSSAMDIAGGRLWYADSEEVYLLDMQDMSRTQVIEELEYREESLSYDPAGNRLIVTDRDTDFDHGFIWAFSTSDYTKTVILDHETGSGDALYEIEEWLDLGNNQALIIDDRSPNKLYQVDMTNGDRIEIPIDFTDAPNFDEAEEAVLSADQTKLYLTDDGSSREGLYVIDLGSEASEKPMSVVSDASMPVEQMSELLFDDPEAIALSSDGLSVYVGDQGIDKLVKVDIATGIRSDILPDLENPSMQQWAERIQGLHVDNDKQLIYIVDENTDMVSLMDELNNEWVVIAN